MSRPEGLYHFCLILARSQLNIVVLVIFGVFDRLYIVTPTQVKVSSRKIMLIRGASVLSKGRIGSTTCIPPLGVAYLAACLRQAHFDVSIVDAYGENTHKVTISHPDFDLLGLTNEEILERIPEDISIFGFSSMFSNEWIYLKELISMVKARFPNAVTVLGGEHASSLPEYSLQSCPALDYLIRGEGETPIVQFATCFFEQPSELHNVPGLAYRTETGVQLNPKGERIKILDEIPFPAWDLIPVENYLKEGIATITRKGSRVMPMLATRGCPYKCRFCSNPQMYGNRYYVRDIGEVIREIEFLKERYSITGFEFDDLTFIIRKPWVKEFCRRLLEKNIKVEWNVPTTRSEAIDEEVVELLKKSGCKNLCMTPDSGSPTMIEKMLKKVDLEHIAETVKVVLGSGVILKVNIVIGFPGERHRDVWQSIFYGMRLAFYGAHSVLFYRFTPYPGSEYFTLLQQQGKLPPPGPEFDKFLVRNIYNEMLRMESYSEYISDFWIRVYMFGGYALALLTFFAVRPWEIFKTIKRVINKNTQTQADLLILSLFERLFRRKTPEKFDRQAVGAQASAV